MVAFEKARLDPGAGPRVLFFAGGSALKGISRVLKSYTHNAIYLVSPFDSGGSTAKLRDAFGMPAVGDIRNRLLQLAEISGEVESEALAFVGRRFPHEASQEDLRAELEAIRQQSHPNLLNLSEYLRRRIAQYIDEFLSNMPTNFDLRGASLGNLMLAGSYFSNNRQLEATLIEFTRLFSVTGVVRATVEDSLHLCAELENGRRVLGQHLLTGKEAEPIDSPVERLLLSKEKGRYVEASCELSDANKKLIESADLICFPPGSFYSSIVANLLPSGVGQAVANNPCPKVYIPNLGSDPEQLGMTLCRCAHELISYLNKDLKTPSEQQSLLTHVIIDEGLKIEQDAECQRLVEQGVNLIEGNFVAASGGPFYSPDKLVENLLSIV